MKVINGENYLTTEEVALRMGKSKGTVYKRLKDGIFKEGRDYHKIGKAYLFRESRVQSMVVQMEWGTLLSEEDTPKVVQFDELEEGEWFVSKGKIIMKKNGPGKAQTQYGIIDYEGPSLVIPMRFILSEGTTK